MQGEVQKRRRWKRWVIKGEDGGRFEKGENGGGLCERENRRGKFENGIICNQGNVSDDLWNQNQSSSNQYGTVRFSSTS
jgi:hypothetical protein